MTTSGSRRSECCASIVAASVALLPVLMNCAAASAQVPCRYEVAHIIQGPPCQFTGPVGLTPAAISPNGMYVTGTFAQCDTGDEAFLWIGPAPGTLLKIPRPAGITSAKGADVNDSGIVVGRCENSATGKFYGFLYKYATAQWITLLPQNPSGFSGANGINNAGTVVGWRGIDQGPSPGDNPREGFIWTEAAGFTGLGVMNGPSSDAYDIAESGLISGFTGTLGSPFLDDTRGFFLQNGTLTILQPARGTSSCITRGVNTSGHVAVQCKSQTSPVALYHSYLLPTPGTYVDLPTPATFDRTGPMAIHSNDLVVGWCSKSSSSNSSACIWQGSQVRLLKDLVNTVPWSVGVNGDDYAVDISETGAILLKAVRPQGFLNVAYLLMPVPPMVGDTDCNQSVNIDDLLEVVRTWGPCTLCSSDFDHNQVVNIDDLLTVLTHWSF